MSCFEGRIEELKNVSIDCFQNKNLYSTTYFLSHCHSDHMKGLREPTFLNRLREEPHVILYCSEITGHILKSEDIFLQLAHKIKELPVGPECLVVIPDPCDVDQEITVTLIPTGHCPGAVMFLLEGGEEVGSILYTGDFRIMVGDAPRFRQLHYWNGTVKQIDKLYLDTTFFSHRYKCFPSRKDSMALLCNLMASWLAKGDDHLAIIQTPAYYGSEAVYITVAKQLGMKIHVTSKAYNIYKNVSEIRDAVTDDFTATRIGVCPPGRQNEKTLVSYRNEGYKVRTFRPCALSFTSDVYDGTLGTAVKIAKDENLVRICYSCHSSYEELEYFVKYLKPERIEACVVPPNMSITATLKLLEEICRPAKPVLTLSQRYASSTILAQGDRVKVVVKEESKCIPLKEEASTLLQVKAEEPVAEKEMDLTDKDVDDNEAELYRMIAEDLQPKKGEGDVDTRSRISEAFFLAAAQKKKPAVCNST